jgi:arylsulfatase A-like enzyme
MGFGAGFDRFVETGPAVGNIRFDPSRKPRAQWLPSGARRFAHETRRLARAAKPSGDSGAIAAIAAFRAWMRDRDGTRPFFAFFNFMEPHLPYSPSGRHAPAGLGRRLRGARLVARLSNDFTLRYNLGLEELAAGDLALLQELYRGEVAGLDERLTDLRAAAGNSVIVTVGDHGENLGDHHQLGHQTSVADTLLHVPLVVSGMGIERGTWTEPVSTAAVAGTLLELAGQNGVAGPTLFEVQAPAAVVSQYESAYVEAAGARALADGPLASNREAVRSLKTRANAVRIGQVKLVARSDGSKAVFDLEADPAEERDVAADRPDLLRRFADVPLWLDPPVAAAPSDGQPQSQELAEIEQRLESLGYL